MTHLRQEFLQFALENNVLKFGTFITKAKRESPYFFNAGLICDGKGITQLADFYAQTIIAENLSFDMLFGPAYKGIILASATAIALANRGFNVPFAYNRKEVKDHGEGGSLVGAPLQGNVLIIDDVISAGTSIRESVSLIQAAGANPVGVLIALNRMEKGETELSAVQEIEQKLNLPVTAIASLSDLFELLNNDLLLKQYLPAVSAYRDRYGT